MELQVDLQITDYRAFLSFLRARARAAKSRDRKVIFIISFFIGIATVFLVKGFGGQIHMPSAIGGAVFTSLVIVTVIFWEQKKSQDYLSPQPGGSLLGNHLYQIRDDAIHVNSSCGTTQLVWSAVKSLEETPIHFFLFIDRSVAFILPKRSFADESVKAQFKAIVAERCGKLA